MKKNQIGIIDYLYILVKWRKLLIVNFIFVCLVAAIISSVIPKWYTAKTTILPPLGESAGMDLSSLINNLPVGGLGISLSGLSEEGNIFLAILNSRTVMETVAQEFELMKQYKTKNMEKTIKALQQHMLVEINEEGTISLYTEEGTPYFATENEKNKARKLAKDMANFFIEELDRVNKQLKTDRARNTRIIIEKRYNQNLEDRRQAEERFKEFQEKYGVIALPEQTEATITAAAELKAQIIAKDVEVGVLSKYMGESHANFIMAQYELNELNNRYQEFRSGGKETTQPKNSDLNDLFLPLEKIPDLGIKYVRLFRELTLQEKLSEFFLPQYEQAKIQEAKNTPTVQILDKAVTPIHRTRPKRMMIILVAGFSCLLLSAIFVFGLEHFRELERMDDERSVLIKKIKVAFINDYQSILNFFRIKQR